jgi:hypothetical protein
MQSSEKTVANAEKQAEIREAWNLIAEKKGALRKKEVFKCFRALGMAPTDMEFSDLFNNMEPKYGKVEFAEFTSSYILQRNGVTSFAFGHKEAALGVLFLTSSFSNFTPLDLGASWRRCWTTRFTWKRSRKLLSCLTWTESLTSTKRTFKGS